MGESCLGIGRCVPDGSCNGDASAAVCVQLSREGEPCGGDQYCAQGTFCLDDNICHRTARPREPCDAEVICQGGRCIDAYCQDLLPQPFDERSFPGDLCGACNAFRDGLTCDRASNRCVVPQVIQEGSCVGTQFCMGSLTTRACDHVTRTCIDLLAAGEPCDGSVPCADGTSCVDGTCGERCTIQQCCEDPS